MRRVCIDADEWVSMIKMRERLALYEAFVEAHDDLIQFKADISNIWGRRGGSTSFDRASVAINAEGERLVEKIQTTRAALTWLPEGGGE